jgi:hypothetical protein
VTELFFLNAGNFLSDSVILHNTLGISCVTELFFINAGNFLSDSVILHKMPGIS